MISKNASPKFSKYTKEILCVIFLIPIIINTLYIVVFYLFEINIKFKIILLVQLILICWFLLAAIEKNIKRFISDIVGQTTSFLESFNEKLIKVNSSINRDKLHLSLPQFQDFNSDLKRVYNTVVIFLLLFYVTSYFTHVLFTKFAWASIGILSVFYIPLGEYLIIDKFLRKYFDFLKTHGFNFDKRIKIKNLIETRPFLKDWLKIVTEGVILTMLLFFIGNIFSILNENHQWFVYIFIGTIYVLLRKACQLISFLNQLSNEINNQCEIIKGSIGNS